MKFLFLLFVIFIFALIIPAQTATPTPKPANDDEDVVKISTTLIQIDVTVTDSNGKIVTDLKPEDFEVLENGAKQDIKNFSFVSDGAQKKVSTARAGNSVNETSVAVPPAPLKPEQVRRTIAIVIDDFSLSAESIRYARQALRKFVAEQMQPNDLVAIIQIGKGIGALQQFTSDKRQLNAAIENIKWNPIGRSELTVTTPLETKIGGFGTAIGSGDDGIGTRDGDKLAADFRASVIATMSLNAINFVVKAMNVLPGRKSMMILSDGFKMTNSDVVGKENDSRVVGYAQKLVDSAIRASVVIYTIDVRGLETLGITAADSTAGFSIKKANSDFQDEIGKRRDEFDDRQEGLTFLARQTGGRAFLYSNSINQSLENAFADQKGFYLIGYQPDSETFDQKTRRFNQLVVKINRPDLKVRYRSGFFNETNEEKRVEKQTPAQQIKTALISPFTVNEIDLRLNTLLGNEAQTGTYVRSLLHVDANGLKFSNEADGSHRATFDVMAISYGENGAVADQISKNYTLTLKEKNYREFLRDGFVYNFVFPVKKPGAYQLRVALRDTASGKVGSASQFIEVPNLKAGELTLSGVVLENLTVNQFQDSQNRATKIESDSESNTSLRRFTRGSVLRYGFEIYNAKRNGGQKPQLNAQTRIYRDGKIFFEGKQTPVETSGQTDLQKINVNGAITLGAEMLPGDYTMQIIVTDNQAKGKNKSAVQWSQFEIVENR